MTNVFISYSRRDLDTCLEFVSALEDAGINYWLDKDRFRNVIGYLKTKLGVGSDLVTEAPALRVSEHEALLVSTVSSSNSKNNSAPASPATRTRVAQNHPDGSVVFLDHRQVWVGYAEGRIVCTKNSPEKVKDFLKARFEIDGQIID